MPRVRGFRILDYLPIVLFLFLIACSVFWSAGLRDGELRVEVEASGVLHVVSLSENGDLTVDGPVGLTRIHVENGHVSVSDSDCRDKICVAMGAISRPTAWIACLPNRVFVRVAAVGDSSDKEAVDDVAF